MLRADIAHRIAYRNGGDTHSSNISSIHYEVHPAPLRQPISPCVLFDALTVLTSIVNSNWFAASIVGFILRRKSPLATNSSFRTNPFVKHFQDQQSCWDRVKLGFPQKSTPHILCAIFHWLMITSEQPNLFQSYINNNADLFPKKKSGWMMSVEANAVRLVFGGGTINEFCPLSPLQVII